MESYLRDFRVFLDLDFLVFLDFLGAVAFGEEPFAFILTSFSRITGDLDLSLASLAILASALRLALFAKRGAMLMTVLGSPFSKLLIYFTVKSLI
jgi:hypothetical protein